MIMKVFIIITMIIFIVLTLQKKGHKNNFRLMFLAILIYALLIPHLSWGHTVIVLYLEAMVILCAVVSNVSVCQYPMYSLLCKDYYKFIIKGENVRYPDYDNNQFMRFCFVIVTIRSVVFLFLFFETGTYCYHLVANEIWWKWLIVIPAMLIFCLAGVIVAKNWYGLYVELH